MQHLTVKATTTAADQELGTFEAIVSGWDEDRERDIIRPDAFDKPIAAWRASGKNLPLLFQHSTEAIGAIDPHSMRPTEAGLLVAGEVDRDSERGQQVWKQIKAGTAGFSIGYASVDRPRKGGGRELIEIDLIEISATSRPMHPATRAVSWKSADPGQRLFDEALALFLAPPSEAELQARAKALDLDRKSKPIKIASFEV